MSSSRTILSVGGRNGEANRNPRVFEEVQRLRPWSDSLAFTRGSDSSGCLKAAFCSAFILRFSGKGSSTKSFNFAGRSERIACVSERFPTGVTLRRFMSLFRRLEARRLRRSESSRKRHEVFLGHVRVKVLDHPQTILS
jgi:hypothetical protein